ncbi:MAG: DUF5615 family PIN-like protein [Dehalococcoidia bacterium]
MMLLAADANFHIQILRGLVRRIADIDIVRAQDVNLEAADDPTFLAWAASEGRVVLTHDIKTMPRFAYDRVEAGLRMPGVFAVNQNLPMALLLKNCCS